jgi:hypothetical protein
MAALDDLSLEDLQALRAGRLDDVSLDGLNKLKVVHKAVADPSLTQAQARSSQVEGLKRGAKQLVTETIPQIGADVAKGAASLALLPGELVRSGINKLAGDPADFGNLTNQIHAGVDSVVPPPTTKAGKRGVEAVSSTVLGLAGPGSIVRNLVSSLGATVGGMAGRSAGQSLEPETAGGNAGIIGGILGAVAGGTGPAAFKTSGNSREMLATALKGLKPADYAEARRLVTQAQANGITLTADQLFPRAAGLDSLFNQTVANSGGAGALQSLVMGQPHEVAAALRNAANRFGPNVGSEKATRDLRLAAEGSLDDIALTQSQRALFEGSPGQRVDGAALGALQDRLSVLETQYKASPETAAQLRRVRDLLDTVSEKATINFGTKPQRYTPEGGAAKHLVRQVPVTGELNLGAPVRDLDTVHKEAKALLEQIRLDTPATSRLVTGKVAGGLDELKALLDDAIPTRPQGRDLYKSMQGRSDANSSGLLGRLAGRSGVIEPNPDPLSMLKGTIGSADAPALAKLTSALRLRAQTSGAAGNADAAVQATTAFPQAARILWDDAVDAAFKSQGGRPPADAGSRFYAAVIGSPGSKKEAAFEQTLQGVAASNGNDPKALSDGFKSLMQVLEASGRNRSQAVPQVVQGVGESTGRDAVRAFGILSLPMMVGGKLQHLAAERQYRQLADVFSNPAALDIIERIGRTSVVSSRQHGLIQALFQVLQQPGRAVAEEPKNGP